MAKIPATESQVFEIEAPMELVYSTFADPRIIEKNFVGLERAEITEDGGARWILKEKADNAIRFKGDYTVRYDGNGTDHVRWRAVAGNIDTDGEVTLTQLSNAVRVEYRETLSPDLPIPGLMARVFRPVVAKVVRKDIVAYIENAKRYISSAKP